MDEAKILKIRNSRLKSLRNSLGLKQKDFAKAVQVSEGLISKIEKGSVPVTDKLITKVALEYDINPDWLKGESEDIRNTEAISESKQLRRLMRYHRETSPDQCIQAKLEQIEVLENTVKNVENMPREMASDYLKILSEFFEKFYLVMFYLKTGDIRSENVRVLIDELEEELIIKLEEFATLFS